MAKENKSSKGKQKDSKSRQITQLLIQGISHDYKRVLSSLLDATSKLTESEIPTGIEPAPDKSLKLRAKLIEIEKFLDEAANDALSKKLSQKDLVKRVETGAVNILDEIYEFMSDSILTNNKLPRTHIRQFPRWRAIRSQVARAKFQISDLLATAEDISETQLITSERSVIDQEISLRKEIKERIVGDISSFLRKHSDKFDESVNVKGSFVGRIDRTMFAVVMSNLIKNSFAHGKKGRDTEINISIKSIKSDASESSAIKHLSFADRSSELYNLIIDYRDNGEGLPGKRRKRENLFKLFEQGDDKNGTGLGSGVGLAFARYAAREMQGKLEALESDKGAWFRLTMPAGRG